MTFLRPSLFLPLLLIGVPLIEIALFVTIGGRIGLVATIAVVVITAVIGSVLLRHQGLAALARAQQAAEAGQMPVEPLVDAVFLFAAGLLLLTPGFLTDAIGFVFFVPAVRRAFAGWAWKALKASGSLHVYEMRGGGATDGDRRNGGGPVIDGTYRDLDATSEQGAGSGESAGTNSEDSPWREDGRS
jgi:UPF0716 protein FxsA